MSTTWRWVIGIVVALLIAGLLAFASGREHRRGDEVGARGWAISPAEAVLALGRG